jgi:uncharacterized protein YjbI with pentapeptide repeats
MGTPYTDGHVPLGRWIGAWLDWLLSRPSALLHQSATMRFLAEFIAGMAILVGIAAAILTAFQFQLELENREEDRVNRAWSLVAAAKEVQGNVGLIEALETLNVRGIDMSRLEIPGTYLLEVKLERGMLREANLRLADLRMANLSRADLSAANLSSAKLLGANMSGKETMLTGANLSGAELPGANLSNADLINTDLSNADLVNATLSNANLARANLNGANLEGANLSGTHLSEAANLTQQQLNTACGDFKTSLPPNLTVPVCIE